MTLEFTMKRPIYQALASLVQAVRNCQDKARPNPEWEDRHAANADQIVADYMPSGSGWDQGTKIDWDASTPDRLVFHGSFHHMNTGGFYDGWTDHTITVRPSLANDFNLTISGRDRNDIKEYLHQVFDHALHLNVEQEKIEPHRYKLAA